MWIFLPDVIIQEILLFIDMYDYHRRFSRINAKKKQLLVWKEEYVSIIHNYYPLYFSFQWIDLKHNSYEQELAMRIIHEKKLIIIHSYLTKLNERYSRKYYKQQPYFTNLYGKTFTQQAFDQRYQQLIRVDDKYLRYFSTTPNVPSCINWKGEDPASWLND